MTEHDLPPDVPEADSAEQQREVWPDGTEGDDDLDLDPLQASEADQLDQARDASPDTDDPDTEQP